MTRLGAIAVPFVLGSILSFLFGVPSAAQASCFGDCNGDGDVTVDELITGVSISLGTVTIAACPQF